MSFVSKKENKKHLKVMRIFGYLVLIVSLFLVLNLGLTWYNWVSDRNDYNKVVATMDNENIVNYSFEGKNYIVDTIGSDSYKQINITKLFKTDKRVTLYCGKEEKSTCVYLNYNYTNPLGTILFCILAALFGGFLVFPNKYIDGFLYTKEAAKKVHRKRKAKKNNKKK